VSLETGQVDETVSPAGRAEEQGGAPLVGGQPDTFAGEETVEDVLKEIEEKEQS
jgi:hypothetical protein